VFEGRASIGYDHGYDAQKFYLGLALDPKYVEEFIEGCLERIGEDDPEDETLFRGLWKDEGESETVGVFCRPSVSYSSRLSSR
jgi:hypothetical protein